ncbi:MAG: 30S ribosomal protein S2 [Acidobacteria bacterium]|nr:30S ribosomal protein S2 [Acidobacteriota bacterium]
MATVTMKELLEAGVHFGHQVRRWNPKMKEYIFGERNGIYIIDLQKTQRMFKEAMKFLATLTGEGTNKTVLFVGTKRQAQDAIKEEALRCNQFYINQRWLGGLLTNFQTIQKSIKRYKDIEAMQADGRIEQYAKKERLEIERERLALEKNLSGIKEMKRLPDAIFVIDTNKEEIAVKEANRLGIPVVAIVDTNCTPEGVDYIIPGNDDALRAVRLFASRIADSIAEGQQLAQQKEAEEAAIAAEQAKASGVTVDIAQRQQRDRGERGGRGRGRGDRSERSDRGDRGGDRGGDRRGRSGGAGGGGGFGGGERRTTPAAQPPAQVIAEAPATVAPAVAAEEIPATPAFEAQVQAPLIMAPEPVAPVQVDETATESTAESA